MKELIHTIKDKKELRSIDGDYVKDRVLDYFKSNPGMKKKFDEQGEKFLRTKNYKIMQKEIRAVLREVYGVFFLGNPTKIRKALQAIQEKPNLENHKQLLRLHRSTNERLGFYKEMYETIFEITGKPKKILDLACGFNPFSYPFLGCEPEYIASDISPEVCSWIQEYFDSQGIKGTSFVFNLLNFEKSKMTSFVKSDVCFLFKTLDSLETIKRDFSEKLVVGLSCKYLVISFARQSLGGKKEILHERRTWLEKILEKNKLEYDLLHLENETFYVVKKA